MALKRTAIASGCRAALLLAMLVGVVAAARSHFAGISPVDHAGAALQRLASIAAGDTAQMGLLALVCIACGILVVLDRRRRARVRQASC